MTAEEIVARIRLESGLRANKLFSDQQILDLANEGGQELYDLFVISFAHWFKETFEFTLAGGPGNNTIDMEEEIPDLQMDQGLNRKNGSGNPETVLRLGNYAERNAYCALIGGAWPGGRRYFTNGDTLEVLPAVNAAGDYVLDYTPQWVPLGFVVETEWALDAAAGAQDNSGTIRYTFGSSPGAHPAFSDAMVGGTLIVTFNSPNAAYSTPTAGTEITGPTNFAGNNIANTAETWPGGSFTNPAAGTASISYQPAGTRNELPRKMLPWELYLVLHASIAIRASRRQPAGTLVDKLNVLKLRVNNMVKTRSEGVTQAPITRLQRSWGSRGGGW